MPIGSSGMGCLGPIFHLPVAYNLWKKLDPWNIDEILSWELPDIQKCLVPASLQHNATNWGKAQGSNPNSGLNGNNVATKEGFNSSDPFLWDFSESSGGPLFKMKISGWVMDGRKRGSSSSVDTFLDPSSLIERMRVESEKVLKLGSLCL